MSNNASRSRGLLLALLAVASCAALVAAAPASADPVWTVASEHGPTNFAPDGTGQYLVRVRNVGDAPQTGTLTVTDTLPAGMIATNVQTGIGIMGNAWVCSGTGTSTVTCTRDDSTPILPASTDAPPNASNGFARAIAITVTAPSTTGVVDNSVLVSGGGGVDASTTDPTTISEDPLGFGLIPGSLVVDYFDGAPGSGSPQRQAGAHPFELRVDFATTLQLLQNSTGTYSKPVEDVHILETKLPAGFVGNPRAVSACSGQQLQLQNCPIESQVGTMDLILDNENRAPDPNSTFRLPVYNMVRPDGAIVALGVGVAPATVIINITLDPIDHSVVATISGVPQTLQLRRASLTVWGVPADPAHDPLRLDTVNGIMGVASHDATNPQPFLTLPSRCEDVGGTRLRFDSWLHPGVFLTETSSSATISGCNDPRMRFNPTISLQPDELTPSTPTGLDVGLTVPQKDDTTATAASQLYPTSGLDMAIPTPPMRSVSVTLPPGMTISPSSVNGLAACSPAQIDLASNDDPTCPDAAKVGTVSIETPVLPAPLEGSVYFATQNDNPFNSVFALYIVAKGQGVMLKLPGKLDPNGVTRQLTATFEDNPQFPFSTLHLRFKGGPRAPLVTPPTCGEKTTNSTLTSWNASLAAVQATSAFQISADGHGAACPARGFDPAFTAGAKNPVAGADTALVTRFSRSDSDQELGNVDIQLPQGLLGRIKDVPLCPPDKADAGTCGEESRIGTVTVGAGPGSDPFFITDGKAYITDKYKGAPFGLSIVVHAKAGPVDLGNVIVRAQIQIDRRTAALRVVSEPLPTVLAGVPLLVRIVDVTVDRPHFTFNPTNCSALESVARLGSTEGVTVTKTKRFQVADCASLPFKPQMTIRVGSKNHTRAGVSTPLQATVKMTKGQANLSSVKVTLPLALNALLPVITNSCTLAQFNAGDCAKARAGSAVAVTPLLAKPLRGSVYFVKDPTKPKGSLPNLMVGLRGQVDVDLAGIITVPQSGRLATNFNAVPDVPITKFTLNLVSGKHGPIGVATNLCSAKARHEKVDMEFRAQSGKLVTTAKPLQIAGCPKKKAKKSARR